MIEDCYNHQFTPMQLAVIIRLILAEKKLSIHDWKSVALISKKVHEELCHLRHRWIWEKRIEQVHNVLKRAAEQIPCVKNGNKTFATLCSRVEETQKIVLPLSSKWRSSPYEEYHCWCENPYAQDGDFEPHQDSQSQHTYFYYSSLSGDDRYKPIYLSHPSSYEECPCKSCVTTGEPRPECTWE